MRELKLLLLPKRAPLYRQPSPERCLFITVGLHLGVKCFLKVVAGASLPFSWGAGFYLSTCLESCVARC